MLAPFFTEADFYVLDFEIWALIFIRISVLVFLLPVIGMKQITPRVKVGLSFCLSLLIFPVLKGQAVPIPDSTGLFFVSALREIYVGLVMGFSASMLFVGLNIAGQLIDQNTGFSILQTFNPMTESNVSVIGQMQFILFSLILIMTGGHLFFVEVIGESFHVIPLLQADLRLDGVLQVLIKITSSSFVYGIKLAAPILVPLLLATAGLAIVAKIMPQVNVWLVGMPLKILVGLGSLIFVLPLIWYVFQKYLAEVQFYQLGLLKIMGSQ